MDVCECEDAQRNKDTHGRGSSPQADTLTIPLVRAALAAFFRAFHVNLDPKLPPPMGAAFRHLSLLISCSFSHTSAWTSGVLTSNISRNLQELGLFFFTLKTPGGAVRSPKVTKTGRES